MRDSQSARCIGECAAVKTVRHVKKGCHLTAVSNGVSGRLGRVTAVRMATDEPTVDQWS
jgi:hypothetical protein